MIIAVSIMRWKTSCQGVLVRRALHFGFSEKVGILSQPRAGLHNLFHPTIRDGSMWSKLGAHGEHGDVFLFSNLGAL